MIGRQTNAFAKVFIALVALAALAIMSGCVATPGSYLVYGERYHPGYDFGELQYYNGDKEMAVEVFNTPFENKGAAQAIAHAMRGRNPGARIAFTAEPGPLTPKQTKVIIAFDLRPADDGYAYCSSTQPDVAEKPETGVLRMVMIYCKRNAFVSSVRARMPQPDSVEDPAFRNMLGETTRRLLPRPHPIYDNDRRRERRRLLDILGY